MTLTEGRKNWRGHPARPPRSPSDERGQQGSCFRGGTPWSVPGLDYRLEPKETPIWVSLCTGETPLESEFLLSVVPFPERPVGI